MIPCGLVIALGLGICGYVYYWGYMACVGFVIEGVKFERQPTAAQN